MHVRQMFGIFSIDFVFVFDFHMHSIVFFVSGLHTTDFRWIFKRLSIFTLRYFSLDFHFQIAVMFKFLKVLAGSRFSRPGGMSGTIE